MPPVADHHPDRQTTATRIPSLRSIPELDGARGLAVLAVFVHHVTLINQDSSWTHLQIILSSIGRYGRFGVDIFFVLSGFLITSLLVRDREHPGYYRDFYWKRILRVLPLYWLLLLGLAIFLRHSAGYLVVAAFFLANFASALGLKLSVATPLWTLAIEEQFYALWPAIVHRRTVRNLARLCLVIAAVSFLSRCLFSFRGHYNYELTFLHCDGLALGAFLACRFARQQSERGAKPSDDQKLLLVFLLAGLASFACSLFVFSNPRLIPYAANAEQTGITLVCTAFIGFLVSNSGTSVVAPLRVKVLSFFGLISYAFYLFHLFVIEFYDKMTDYPAHNSERSYFLRMTVCLVASVALSIISRYLLELPVMSLRRRVLSRPTLPAESEHALT